jgi:hypothetical protein
LLANARQCRFVSSPKHFSGAGCPEINAWQTIGLYSMLWKLQQQRMHQWQWPSTWWVHSSRSSNKTMGYVLAYAGAVEESF